jgi:hypothetical protein
LELVSTDPTLALTEAAVEPRNDTPTFTVPDGSGHFCEEAAFAAPAGAAKSKAEALSATTTLTNSVRERENRPTSMMEPPVPEAIARHADVARRVETSANVL